MTAFRKDFFKAADAVIGGPLCRAIGRLNRFERQPPYPPVRLADLRRILVVRPGGLGDMVLLLPALFALRARAPAAELLVVCERRNLDVLQFAGMDSMALAFDREPGRCLRRIVQGRFDACIDTEQFHHFSAVLVRLSRAPVRIGFKINPIRNPLYTHMVDYQPDGPEASQFLRLLSPLGIAGESDRIPGLLAQANLPMPAKAGELRGNGRGYVVLHPGASARYKRWPAERFAKVARTLRAEQGLACAILGDAHDRDVAGDIVRALPGDEPVENLAGTLSLRDTAAWIRHAQLFVGIDSGLAHLATAMDRRTVVVFGATDSGKWGIRDERRTVVRSDLSCAPCCIFGYHRPCRTIACMAQVQADDVLRACRLALGH